MNVQHSKRPLLWKVLLIGGHSGVGKTVVANHVATDTPTIFEGDGVLPALAARRVFANRDAGTSVRAVFLIEEYKTRLFRSAMERGRGFELLTPGHQRHQVRVSWLYGQWLKQEVVCYGLPVVTPHPWETLAERIVNVIQ